MRIGVTVFPGTNNEWDTEHVLSKVLQCNASFVKPEENDLSKFDAVVLAGGFSYGDYLRVGAIASQQPVLDGIKDVIKEGKPVIGICNGFQILTDAGHLPGSLMQNASTRFVSKAITLRVENTKTPFTHKYNDKQLVKMYIAHYDGNFIADNATINMLEKNNQIVFRYVDINGNVTPGANPNGSVGNIAGIVNKEGTVLGMMPHPERSSESILGTKDGLTLWQSLQSFLKGE